MKSSNRHEAHPESVWLWEDGGYARSSGIPARDRGFRYGMAVFETILIRDGTPVFLAAHLSCLEAACNRAGFLFPHDAGAALPSVLKDLPGLTGTLRIYVTAGDGGPLDSTAHGRVVLVFGSRKPIPSEKYAAGYGVVPVAWATGSLSGIKTACYWPHVEALRTARANGADEALLLTPGNRLISAAMANVFVVAQGRILTPCAGEGARPGVVREWVISRTDVHRERIPRQTAETAEEIFLTSSWIGIMPVCRMGDRKLPSTAVAQRLLAEYREELTRQEQQ